MPSSAYELLLINNAIGMAVTAIGTIHFSLKGDPFGYVALGLTTAVLLWSALRSARQAPNTL